MPSWSYILTWIISYTVVWHYINSKKKKVIRAMKICHHDLTYWPELLAIQLYDIISIAKESCRNSHENMSSWPELLAIQLCDIISIAKQPS